MRFYADHPDRRAGQIIADFLSIAAIVGAVVAGVVLHRAIDGLAEPALEMEQTGASFEESLGNAADGLAEVPLIGEDIADPFTRMAESAGQMRESGAGSAAFAQRLAVLVGVLTPVVVLAIVVTLWWRPRLLWLREADDARSVLPRPDGHELLAGRAVARVRLPRLAAQGDDVIRRWHEEDSSAVLLLARAELDRLGLDYRVLPDPGHEASAGRSES